MSNIYYDTAATVSPNISQHAIDMVVDNLFYYLHYMVAKWLYACIIINIRGYQ